MPVQWEGSIEATIKSLIEEGKPEDQAAAIAYDLGKEHGVSKAFMRDLELLLPICKFDDAQQTVTGWAATTTDDAGNMVVDFQDEHVPVAELEKVAHDIVANGGAGMAGEMHDRRSGDLIESMVVDKAKREALGFGPPRSGHPSEGWAVTMRLDDPAWANYKAGTRSEMSMHGKARMVPIGKRGGRDIYMRSDLQVDEISIVDRGASGNDRVQPRIVLAKRKEEITPMPKQKKTPDAAQDLSKGGLETLVELESAAFTDEQKKIVYALLEAAKGAPMKAEEPKKEEESPAVDQAIVDNMGKQLTEEEAKAKKKKEEDEAAAKKKAAAEGPVAKALAGMDPDPRAVMEKALADKSASEAREELQKRHDEEKAELNKKVDDLVEITKKLKDERELAEMTKRAEDRPYVTAFTTEQQAEHLIEAKRMGEDRFKRVDKMFATINKASEESDILRQIGSDKNTDENDPMQKLEAMAKKRCEELRKDVNGKKVTIAQARRDVYRENPELYAEATEQPAN